MEKNVLAGVYTFIWSLARLVSSLTLGQEFVTYLSAPQPSSAVRGGLEKHLEHFFLFGSFCFRALIVTHNETLSHASDTGE